jgi:predicted transcriptional regulator
VLAALSSRFANCATLSKRVKARRADMERCLHSLWAEGLIDRKIGRRGKGAVYRLFPKTGKPRLSMPPPSKGKGRK